jgi:hypothetical protein
MPLKFLLKSPEHLTILMFIFFVLILYKTLVNAQITLGTHVSHVLNLYAAILEYIL